MASPQLLKFRQLRIALESMTQILRKIPDPTAMNKHSHEVAKTMSAGLAASVFTSTHSENQIIQPEYAAFITSLSASISVIVITLKKSDKVVGSKLWSQWFPVVWNYLLVACQMFYKWEEMLLDPGSNWSPSPSEGDLRNSMTQLLVWMLSASRRGGWAWRSLDKLNVLKKEQILMILHLSMQSFNNVFRTLSDVACIVNGNAK